MPIARVDLQGACLSVDVKHQPVILAREGDILGFYAGSDADGIRINVFPRIVVIRTRLAVIVTDGIDAIPSPNDIRVFALMAFHAVVTRTAI